MSIHQLLESIASISGTNDKLALLEKHKGNEELKKVVLYALDPRRNFNIRKIPQYVHHVQRSTLNDAFNLLDKFVQRELTGTAAQAALQIMLAGLSPDDAKVLERILDKSLDCGIQDKGANKVFGKNFIQETPYMRCDLTNNKTLAKMRWKKPDGTAGVYGEIKADGQYLNHHVVQGFYNAESRNGKSYDFLGVSDNDFLELAVILREKYGDKYPLQNITFNGEGVVVDETGKVMPRTVGNGIIQKFGKGTGSILDAGDIRFILWDFLPYEAHMAGEWNVPRESRRVMLDTAINELKQRRVNAGAESVIRMVEYRPLMSFAEAFAWNTEVMGRGEEGIIIKDERGTWKFHTSPYQLKLKLVFDVELVVVGRNEGKGKFAGTLGSLICETSDGLLQVAVSGWKEKVDPKDPDSVMYTRDWIWENYESCIKGAILSVTANDILLKDGNGTVVCNLQDEDLDELVQNSSAGDWSLFLPRVCEWRGDKSEADTLKRCFEIKQMVIAAGGQMGTDAL